MSVSEYTTEQLLAGINAALEASDMRAVAAFLTLLATQSPRDAQTILDALEGRR